MSIRTSVTTFSAVTLALALGAAAQAADPQSSGQAITNSYRASDLEGMPINGTQGREIGEISEVIISPDGKVSHVVMSKGGVLGVGGDKYLVPWNRIRLQPDQNIARVDVNEDKVAAEFAAYEEDMIKTKKDTGDTGSGAGRTGTGGAGTGGGPGSGAGGASGGGTSGQ